MEKSVVKDCIFMQTTSNINVNWSTVTLNGKCLIFGLLVVLKL